MLLKFFNNIMFKLKLEPKSLVNHYKRNPYKLINLKKKLVPSYVRPSVSVSSYTNTYIFIDFTFNFIIMTLLLNSFF
jgi:hypothetical protein